MYVRLILINTYMGNIFCCGIGWLCRGTKPREGAIEVIWWLVIQIFTMFFIHALVGFLICTALVPQIFLNFAPGHIVLLYESVYIIIIELVL